jgi:beta-glucanase (GH16 family)
VVVAAVTVGIVRNRESGGPAGFTQVFSDDFSGSALDSAKWKVYDGHPDNEPYTQWRPSNVWVDGGTLSLGAGLQNGTWVAGGLANTAVAQTYGKWEVRFRIDKSDEVGYAILLWPEDEQWPPEIDFAENTGGDRSSTTATVHYGSNNSMIEREVSGDFTQWHTVGVTWEPGKVSYTLDGQPWGGTVTEGVPDQPMSLAIQLHGASCERYPGTCPKVGTPDYTRLQVDWVKIWSYGG